MRALWYNSISKEEDEEERQLALMEKSYQIAAKYLPKSTSSNNNAFTEAKERTIVPAEAKRKGSLE